MSVVSVYIVDDVVVDTQKPTAKPNNKQGNGFVAVAKNEDCKIILEAFANVISE